MGCGASQQLSEDVQQALAPEKAPKKSAKQDAEKTEVVLKAERPCERQEPEAKAAPLVEKQVPEPVEEKVAEVKEKVAEVTEPARGEAAEPKEAEAKPAEDKPIGSEETSDATRKAETWVFSLEESVEADQRTPAQRLKATCMKFRPEIMKLPGVRGIRVKTTEQGPVVLLRIRHRQPAWAEDDIPAFMKADPETENDYLLVDEEGSSIMVGETAARLRVFRKKPQLPCLAEPDNHIGAVSGGCLKGEELAEPLVLEGKAVAPDVLAQMGEEEAQPSMGIEELASDLAEDAEERAMSEQGEPMQPTDVHV